MSSNSPLVSYTDMSPNNSGVRTSPISRITPHCTAGLVTIEALGRWFAASSTQASSNYGIDRDGRVGLFVDEGCRAWTSGSRDNDQRAVTIECASYDAPPYAFPAVTYARLIALCVDICQRNDKITLLWIPDKDTALAYKPKPEEMLLTVHRWFSNKACPGEWLMERMQQLADTVTEMLRPETIYRVQVGAFRDRTNAKQLLAKLAGCGFTGFIVEGR